MTVAPTARSQDSQTLDVESLAPQQREHSSQQHEPVPPAPPADPGLLGLPVFILASLALGLSLTTFLPSSAAGGILPILMAATGLGLVVSTVWAAAVGQGVVAGIFGIFAGFWLSYSVLVLGLTHNWFAVAAADVKDTVGTFQLCWAIIIGVLTVATLRLPRAFTVLLALVTVALVVVCLGTYSESTSLSKVGGYIVLAFALNGIYLFVSAMSVATGGKGLPLGPPAIS